MACRRKPRHDQVMCWAAEPGERIIALLHLVIERDIGRHFALELEIGGEAFEDFDRVAQFLDVNPGRIAEGGVAGEGDTRLKPHSPGECG